MLICTVAEEGKTESQALDGAIKPAGCQPLLICGRSEQSCPVAFCFRLAFSA